MLFVVLLTYLAVSSIDRYASIGGLSNQSASMATQVGSAVIGDRKLASVMSLAEHGGAVKQREHSGAVRQRGSGSVTSGM